ncbi:MAG: DUF547 domain-containing protein [Pseudomonadota bacterium]
MSVWKTVRRLMIAPLAIAVSGCVAIERAYLPTPAIKTPVFTSFSVEGAAPDHGAWDAFLERYRKVDAEGVARVDYGAVTDADRTALTAYLARLQAADPARMTRDQALAFWLNLYNAKTVDVVLSAYPVASIRDIGAPLIGPWDQKNTVVSGVPLSLNDIEHRVIRPIFNEPRIHYALNCAAYTCPNLAATAWRADGLQPRLAEAERAYVNDPRGLSVDATGRVSASKIYAWFREDFGEDEAEIVSQLADIAEPSLADALRRRGRVDAYVYDWALNDWALVDDAN